MEESVSTSSGMDSGATSSTTSSPSSVSTSESRPSSFSEAFERVGATDTPNPGDVPADQLTQAPAIQEPDTADAQAPVVDTTATPVAGPIPVDRHKAILQETRQKTAQEVVSQVQQRFGGAIQFQQQLASDPIGTLTQLVDEAVSDPRIGQQFVSHLARTLSARRNLTPIETEVGPVYTADQMEALLDQKLAERIGPIEQERRAAEQQRAIEQVRTQTRETVKTRLGQWQKQPGFKEHEPQIAAKQAEYVANGHDTWSALGFAYADVVIPTLKAQQATQFVQEAVKKAQASTNNPATVAPISQPRPRSFAEAFAQVRKQA